MHLGPLHVVGMLATIGLIVGIGVYLSLIHILRTLSNHIDLACYHCTQRQAQAAQPARTLEELTQVYGLTRRETEILGLVFQDRNNEEILEQLHISKNTLLKHLQNLYRKCGVSSRWDLLKLR